MTHSASFFSSPEIDADTPTPLSSIGEESSAPCLDLPTVCVGETAHGGIAELVDYFGLRGECDRARLEGSIA